MSALLLLLLACASSPAPPPAVEADAFPLDGRAYRFCHVPGADADAARPWCPLVDEIPEARCPGLRATCEGAEPAPPSGCTPGGGGGPGTPDQVAAPPEAPQENPLAGLGFDLEGFDAVMRWVMAILVALGILVLARFLWSRFGWGGRPEAVPEAMVEAVDDDALDDALPEVPAAPSSDLLGMAEAALADGRAGEAVVLARGAALRVLGERQVLRLHRSRTDREYVREAPAGEVRTALRTVVAMAEAFRFGHRAPDEGAARAALEAAARLVRAGGLLLLLLALGGAEARAQTPERYGPNGDAALLELLDRWGYAASWRITPLDTLGDEVDVLLLDATTLTPDEATWEAVRAWVEEDGGVLVVAGPTGALPELGIGVVAEGPLQVTGPAARAGLPVPVFVTEPFATLPDGAEPWLVDGAGHAVVHSQRLGRGVLVAVADAHLIWNASLAVPANERFLGDLLLAGKVHDGWPVQAPVRVQLATQGAVASSGGGGGAGNNPLSALARSDLLAFVLQLLALWALLGLWRGWPFGPRHDPPDTGRLRFADHLDALGERYRRVGDTRAMLVAYADLWLARLGPGGLQLAAEAKGWSPEAAKAWVAGLEALVAAPEGPAADDDLERMEALWTMVEGR